MCHAAPQAWLADTQAVISCKLQAIAAMEPQVPYCCGMLLLHTDPKSGSCAIPADTCLPRSCKMPGLWRR
jgi:hypothetical protein